jgi:hypothetical protein
MSHKHIHYGDWTIEWIEHENRGYNFAIGTHLYRMDWRGIEPIRIQFGNFETIEKGINQCQQSIGEIIQQQKRVAEQVAKQYRDSINPPDLVKLAPIETQGEGE